MKIIKSFFVLICIVIGLIRILAIASVTDNHDKKTPSIISTKLTTLEKRVNQLYAELRYTENQQQPVDVVYNEKTLTKPSYMFGPNLGAYVVIGPSINDPAAYGFGSELIVSYSVINADTQLLLRRYAERKALQQQGMPMPVQPRLILSGEWLAQAQYLHPYVGASNTDIGVTYAELDTFFEITSLVNGFIAFFYEDVMLNGTRLVETSVYSAFITMGDFAKSPFYLSGGQMYLPFGRYESYMITDPLSDIYPYTATIGKNNTLGIVLGYESHGHIIDPYVRVFIAENDTKYGNGNIAKQHGLDTGFKYKSNNWNMNLGASYIANLADADSMVDVAGSSEFSGFHQSRLQHNVEGLSVYGDVGIAKFDVLFEYITALRKFAPNDLSFNDKGAKPSAFNTEVAYEFNLFKRQALVAVGYTQTYESLALNIPKDRYAITSAISITKNLIIYLEYAYETNYGVGDTATGIGSDGTPVQAYNPALLGKHNNSVTAQIGVYF